MTSTAQMALRRIMEKYTANTRFCIIANYTHKLSPALLSRCTRFRFSPLKEVDIRVLIDHVIEQEGVRIEEEAVQSLVRLSKGDMRRALNVLQACHASSTSSYLALSPKKPTDRARYTASCQGTAKTGCLDHQTRPHHQRHYIRLHSGPSPNRHSDHPRHRPLHLRCHILPEHNQHAQSKQGTGVGGYTDRPWRGASKARSTAADESDVAGRVGGSRV